MTKKEIEELPFEKRAELFQKEIQPLCLKFGLVPWAALEFTQERISASPVLRDVWQKSSKE